MEKIYIVAEFGGSYYDAWRSNAFATTDRTKAENFIKDAKVKQEAQKRFDEAGLDAYNLYTQEHPVPTYKKIENITWDGEKAVDGLKSEIEVAGDFEQRNIQRKQKFEAERKAWFEGYDKIKEEVGLQHPDASKCDGNVDPYSEFEIEEMILN